MIDKASPTNRPGELVVRCQQCARKFPNRTPTAVALVQMMYDAPWADHPVISKVQKFERWGNNAGPDEGRAAEESHTWGNVDIPRAGNGRPKLGAVRCRNCGHTPAQMGLDAFGKRAVQAASHGQTDFLA